jgi:DNA-binding MarR family transcriptional regulator
MPHTMTTDAQLAKRATPPSLLSASASEEDRNLPRNVDGLDDVIGLHVARVYALLTFQLERDLAPLRLTPKEVSCLWLINANPGIPQAALARYFGIERSSVNVVIKSLIQRELVRAEQNPDDRRVFGLSLSDTGHAKMVEAKAIVAAHERWLCEPISSDAVQDLRGTLEALARIKR